MIGNQKGTIILTTTPLGFWASCQDCGPEAVPQGLSFKAASRARGLGFRVWDSRFRVWSVGFRVSV